MNDFERQNPGSRAAFYQGRFETYFDGLILDDRALTHEAGHVLSEFGSPFADTLKELARTHATLCTQHDASDGEWASLAGNSIRAYVYSGFLVNKNLVLLAASRADMSEQELRNWIDPAKDEGAFEKAFGGKERYQRAKDVAAGVGRDALKILGINTST